MRHATALTLAAGLLASAGLIHTAQAQNAPAPAAAASAPRELPKTFSFFITSEPIGKGADLGGLAGADAHCQKLATAVGAGGKTWRAYLSTQAAGGQAAVNARDRIGAGPWVNARGAVVGKDLAHLHGDSVELARLGNNLTKATVFTEKNEAIKGFGDKPNEHDVLTGSQPDGTAYTDAADHTCRNYTSSGEGTVQLGHFDRTGGGNTSWNSAHASRGCSQANLVSTGGAGHLYCFATN
jgi:hypothetical protein